MLSWQRKRLQNHKQQSYDAHTSLEDLPAGGTGSLKSMCVHLKTAQTVNSTRQNRDLSLLRRTTILSTVMQGEREITSKNKAGVCELWKYQLQGFLSGGQDAKGPACNKLVFRGLMGLRKALTLSCEHSFTAGEVCPLGHIQHRGRRARMDRMASRIWAARVAPQMKEGKRVICHR